jgi:hypothetical protein
VTFLLQQSPAVLCLMGPAHYIQNEAAARDL